MEWNWGPGNWLWQIVHNPLQLLDAAYAKKWYAESSAANWQSGGISDRLVAVLQDASGGFIATFTGSPQSAAQAWWSVGLTVPTFFFGGAAAQLSKASAQALVSFNALRSSSAALYAATDSLTGGQQLTGLDAGLGILGLAGDLATGTSVSSMLKLPKPGTPITPWDAYRGAYDLAEGIGLTGNAISTIGWGNDVINAAARSAEQSIESSLPDLAPSLAPAPDVGGVLFDARAELLTDVAELEGAYWDADEGALVLVGKDGDHTRRRNLRLPPMDRDHLGVALRAAVAGQPVGVSIDAPENQREVFESGHVPPDGTPLVCSYLGGCAGTLTGAILIESDLVLKWLTAGAHNGTGETVRAKVPGFRTLLEMLRPGSEVGGRGWHRFWFVIDRVELKHDSRTESFAFGETRLSVLTEDEAGFSSGGSNPICSEWARHLTENLDLYARDFPVLARLKELAKIAAVSRVIVDRGVALDLDELFSTAPARVDTPSTTPGVTVRGPAEVTHEGNVMRTRSVSLFGGVDLEAVPVLLPDDGSARNLRAAAERGRPAFGANWAVEHERRAVAVELGRSRVVAFRDVRVDHPSSTGAVLRRRYDSQARREGDFGPGWSLDLPYTLTVVQSDLKSPEALDLRAKRGAGRIVLVLHDHAKRSAQVYRGVGEEASDGSDGERVFCRVTAYESGGRGRFSFEYDAGDRIVLARGFYRMDRDGKVYRFDAAGALVEERTSGGAIISYERSAVGGGVERVVSGGVRRIALERDAWGRVVETRASDGSVVRYVYHGETGHLIEAGGEGYRYDAAGRLAEVRSADGRLVLRNAYDPAGELLSAPNGHVARIRTPDEGEVEVTFEDGGPRRLRDESGATVELREGAGGSLEMSIDPDGDRGHGWRLRYGPTGQLEHLRLPGGERITVRHDERDRVASVEVGPRRSRAYERDTDGRVVAVTDAQGVVWRLEYGGHGMPTSVTNSRGENWRLRYVGRMLVSADGPAARVRVRPRRGTLSIELAAGGRPWRCAVVDRELRLRRLETRGSGRIEIGYAEGGALESIEAPAGSVRYRADTAGSSVLVSFGS